MAATTSSHSRPILSNTSHTIPHPTSKSLQNINLDTASTDSSRPSSIDSRQVEPIPEGDEDETSSEAAIEPITPTDSQHPHQHAHVITGDEVEYRFAHASVQTEPPLIVNTAATQTSNNKDHSITPKSPKRDENITSAPLAQRPPLISRPSGFKARVSNIFRRTNSVSDKLNTKALVGQDQLGITNNNGSDSMIIRENLRTSINRVSTSTTAFTSRSNTPPSPSEPSEHGSSQENISFKGRTKGNLTMTKKQRSSTGLGMLTKLTGHGPKISFATPESVDNQLAQRSTSVDWDPSTDNDTTSEIREMPRAVWGMPAETGIGLKSRRLSMSLPDDFTIDIGELDEEFTSKSKLGLNKVIGKGATANVTLMVRKGSQEVYAVKEFRGKSANEKKEDYEKKVKSEFSIAQSARHPNIVKTIRLCTHNGRWNHVMEYCEGGDLFTLVGQKYLNKEDHQKDRQCLFKQLIQAINYLHSNGLAHRDIKLENLLITKDSKLKLTDFGVSEVFAGTHPGLSAARGKCGQDMAEIRLCAPGICGSLPYIAPEVIAKKGEYDPRPLDVWGAAIVMLGMTAGGCLWPEAKSQTSSQYDELVRGWEKWNGKHTDGNITDIDYPHVSFFDKHINPPALRRILLTMLNPDPTKRATISDIAKNRWMKNVECCQIDSYDGPTRLIDASKSSCCSGNINKVVNHNHFLPSSHHGHKLVRLPGSTDMY